MLLYLGPEGLFQLWLLKNRSKALLSTLACIKRISYFKLIHMMLLYQNTDKSWAHSRNLRQDRLLEKGLGLNQEGVHPSINIWAACDVEEFIHREPRASKRMAMGIYRPLCDETDSSINSKISLKK